MGRLRQAGALLAGGLAMVAAAGCGGEQPAPDESDAAAETMPAAPSGATAALADAQGNAVGEARLSADSAGVAVIDVDVSGLAAGRHGVHVHAVGSCEARGDTAFAAAGGHLNPAGMQHGLDNPQGPHAGDTRGLEVGADGSGTAHLVLEHATLDEILDADGAALVVHAQPDDQKTDPSGASGARVACGVFQAG